MSVDRWLVELFSKTCAVCHQLTSEFNYGVHSCNACKMFIRRQAVRKTPFKPCTQQENCYQAAPLNFGCQLCRFQKCIEVGMNIQPLLQKTSIQELLRDFSAHHMNRVFLLLNSYPADSNLTIEQMLQEETSFVARQKYHEMSWDSWYYITLASTVYFMKQFPFVYFARIQDRLTIIRETFLKVALFSASFRAYALGEEFITFPDGSSIFPSEETERIEKDLSMSEHITGRLISKMRELQIANEEFLLVLVIVLQSSNYQSIRHWTASSFHLSKFLQLSVIQIMFNENKWAYTIHGAVIFNKSC